jgi:hypothetical protein
MTARLVLWALVAWLALSVVVGFGLGWLITLARRRDAAYEQRLAWLERKHGRNR